MQILIGIPSLLPGPVHESYFACSVTRLLSGTTGLQYLIVYIAASTANENAESKNTSNITLDL